MQPTRSAARSLSEPPQSPDAALIARVVAGDTNAFEGLMRRYNRMIYRTVRSVVRSDAEAEDVAQEAWVAAYRHLEQFEGRANFATWVRRIAYRAAVARARRRPALMASAHDDRLTNGASAPDRAPESAMDDPAQKLHRRQLARLLERAIDMLPTDQRIVLVLRDVQQLSTAETAESLGLSEANVRVRLHRSHQALRELLTLELGDALEEVFSFDGQRCDRLVRGVLSALRKPGH